MSTLRDTNPLAAAILRRFGQNRARYAAIYAFEMAATVRHADMKQLYRDAGKALNAHARALAAQGVRLASPFVGV